MWTNKLKLSSLLLVVFLLLPTAGFARGRGGDGEQRILKQLDLTKEQKEQLSKMRESSKEEFKRLRTERKQIRNELKEAFMNDKSDSELTAIHKKMQDLQTKMGDLRFNKVLKIHNLLTKDQRAKFYQLKEQRMEKAHGKKKRRFKGRRSQNQNSDEE